MYFFAGVLGESVTDRMSFYERFWNTVYMLTAHYIDYRAAPFYEAFLRSIKHELPPKAVSRMKILFYWSTESLVQELMKTPSLFFTNSEPFIDFPRLSNTKVIDIGGIAVSKKHAPLNQVHFYSHFEAIHFSDLPEQVSALQKRKPLL